MAQFAKRQQAYLEALRLAEPGSHPVDVLRSVGAQPRELVAWRKVPRFVAAEEPLLGEFRERQALPVPPQFLQFLDKLRECDDRILAAKAAKVKWSEVQTELEHNAVFKAEFDTYMLERNLQLEDALFREGRAGTAASGRAYLAVNDPRFGKADQGNTARSGAPAENPALADLFRRLNALNKPAPAPPAAPIIEGDFARLPVSSQEPAN